MGNIKTYVAALYELRHGFDADRSQIAVVNQKTLRNPYLLGGLVTGSYQVAGWQDLNGDGKVNAGEPFGIYVNSVTGKPGVSIDAVARTILGINVQLKPFQATSAATDLLAPDGGPAAGAGTGGKAGEVGLLKPCTGNERAENDAI